MKTTTRAATTPSALPPAQHQTRQRNIAFETLALQGFSIEQRSAATRALAMVLLQAAGVPLTEGDDVEL